MESVLILHNTFGDAGDELYESRAGVMDQVQAVAQALAALGVGFEILAVENLRHLTAILSGRRETVIVNLAEEFLDSIQEACYVPAVCRAFGKSCTGSDTPALLLAQNKIFAKAVLLGEGLPCPQGIAVAAGQKPDWHRLPAGRYIAKPAFCDASEGISAESVFVLPDERQAAEMLLDKLHRQFAQPVIVEQFIPARELNVSVIQHGGRTDVMPLAEIDFSAFSDAQPRIVDYDAKWRKESFGYSHTPRRIPADIPPQTAGRIAQLAAAAFETLGCRDYARVDFRLDQQLHPYILEVNPNPDISPDAGFAAAIAAGGLSYGDFIHAIITNAHHRQTES